MVPPIATESTRVRAAPGRGSRIEIQVEGMLERPEWNRLCTTDAASTFFHTRAWCDVVASTIRGWHPACIVARDHGRVIAALPFMLRNRAGLRVLASMPFGGYGGVLTAEDAGPDAIDALTRRFFEMSMAARVAYGELVDFSGRMLTHSPPGVMRAELEAHHVDLSAGTDSVWHNVRPSNRNKIRHARHAGVTVRRAQTDRDYGIYQRIHRHCSREWGRRPAPRAFFRRLSASDTAHVEMWLAESNHEVVAGLLNFVHDGTVMNWGSVSLPAGKQLAATNLLHAVAIDAALERGAGLYNFGSNPGLPGVDQFKSSFGTTRRPYSVYRVEHAWYRMLRSR